MQFDSFVVHKHIEVISKNNREGNYSLLYPTTCTFSNNTSESVSISEYGPRLIDGLTGHPMISESHIYPTITLASHLSQIVDEKVTLPLLISPNEQFVFKSVIAVPIKKIFDAEKGKCIEPTLATANTNIHICSTNKKIYPLGNYTNLYFSVGFVRWSEYGTGLKLGNGKEVIYQTSHQFTPIECKIKGVRELRICKSRGSYTLPKPYWTNTKGQH